MSQQQSAAVAEPEQVEQVRRETASDKRPKRQPRYHVILWDDPQHTFEYVMAMLQKLFGYPLEQGFKMAEQVHNSGKVICLTTTLEHAELKRDQIHAFGKDGAVAECKGSMYSTIEAER
jgi:ATP-dependent Clp protease adaptor protein ClpS